VAVKTDIIKDEKSSSCKIKFIVDAADVDKKFKEILEEIRPKAQIKGFRAGKAPVGIIKMKYGESIKAEVAEKLISQAYKELLDKDEIKPVGQAQLDGDLDEIVEGKDFTFSMKIDLFPEFELGNYKQIAITKDSASLTPKDVDKAIENTRKKYASMEDIKDGIVTKDSIVGITYSIEINGEVEDKFSDRHFNYDQRTGSTLPDLKDSLIGKKIGDEIDSPATIPADFRVESLAGKDVVYKVKINTVQKEILPELDDDFAQSISEFKTMEEYKQALEKDMEKHIEDTLKEQAHHSLVKSLIEQNEINIPEEMIKTEKDSLYKSFEGDITRYGIKMEQYIRGLGKTEEDIKNDFHDTAIYNIKRALILKKIVDNEDFKVEESEMEKEIMTLAKAYNYPIDEMKKELEKSNYLSEIEYNLKNIMALEFLEENAKIKKGKKLSYEELLQNNSGESK